MQYGYLATNSDYCVNARTLVELAKMAEDAGWDGPLPGITSRTRTMSPRPIPGSHSVRSPHALNAFASDRWSRRYRVATLPSSPVKRQRSIIFRQEH